MIDIFSHNSKDLTNKLNNDRIICYNCISKNSNNSIFNFSVVYSFKLYFLRINMIKPVKSL